MRDALTRLCGAIPGAAERGDGIESRIVASPRLGDERSGVGLECVLERALRHCHITGLLVGRERRMVDKPRLCVSQLELVDGLQHVFQRIFEVVALIDQVRRPEAR